MHLLCSISKVLQENKMFVLNKTKAPHCTSLLPSNHKKDGLNAAQKSNFNAIKYTVRHASLFNIHLTSDIGRFRREQAKQGNPPRYHPACTDRKCKKERTQELCFPLFPVIVGDVFWKGENTKRTCARCASLSKQLRHGGKERCKERQHENRVTKYKKIITRKETTRPHRQNDGPPKAKW